MDHLSIQLSDASGVPFYRQIVDQVAQFICSGQLAPNSRLPSVRDLAAQLGPVLASLAKEGRYASRLAVRDRNRIRVLPADEVDWISVDDERTIVHAAGSAYPIRHTLAELEARLDPALFFRAHRAAIVNLDRVQEIIPWFKGSHKLRLTTGDEVELSRARARALREVLRW